MNKQQDLTRKYRNEIYIDCNLDLPDQANKSLNSLLDIDIHKLKINPESENLIKKFIESIQNIEAINKDPENLIYEKICDLKKQVNSEREKVNLYADSLITYLEWYESDLKKYCKSNIIQESSGKLVDEMKIQLNENITFFKSLNDIPEVIKNKNKLIQYDITYLDNEIKEYEKELFRNKFIFYQPMNTDFGIYFGKIIEGTYPTANIGNYGNFTQVSNIPGLIPFLGNGNLVGGLPAALPHEQKQMLGDRLYPLVHSLHPEWAANIIYMLLDNDNGEILRMLNSREALKAKADEAANVLKGSLKINSNKKK